MEEKSSRLQNTVALLIAIAAVVTAIIAWRASLVADASGDADFAGLKASLNVEETRALNTVNAYEHYSAFTSYKRYNGLAERIDVDLQDGAVPETEADLLARQMAEDYDLARSNQFLFEQRFVTREGGYAFDREMAEMWADASRQKDLKPEVQYAEADKLRDKTNLMLLALTIVSLSLIFYTLVETVEGAGQYVLIALGTVALIGGTIASVLIEFAG